MPDFIVEVEDSTITTYRVSAPNDVEASKAALLYKDGEILEEHEEYRVRRCLEAVH